MRSLRFLLPTATLAAALLPAQAHATGSLASSSTGKGIAGGALLGAEVVLATEAAFDVQPAWAYLVGGLGGGVAGGVGGFFIEDAGNARATMMMLAGGMALAIPTTVAVLSATAYEPPANYVQDTAPADEPVAEPPHPTETAMPPAAPAAPAPSESTAPAAPATTPAPAAPATTPAPAAPATAPAPAETPAAPPAAAPAPSGAQRSHHGGRLALHRPRLRRPLPPPALIALDPQALTLNVPAVEFLNLYTPTERAMFGVAQATEIRVPVLNFVF